MVERKVSSSISKMLGWCVTSILVLLSLGEFVQAQRGRNIPVITDASEVNNKYLPENLPIGTAIGTIKAYDPDGTKVSFSIIGAGLSYFAINVNTGVVTLKQVLNYEEVSEIRLTIQVKDEDNQITTQDMKIFVNDENDNLPIFHDYGIFKRISEGELPGTLVTPITVNDLDTKNEILTVTCGISTNSFRDACDKFEVVVKERSNKNWIGEIRLRKQLDYETRVSYAIQLIAYDGVHYVTNEVHIEVDDLNDTPPRWVKATPVTIDEEMIIGSYVQDVSAVDGDTTLPHTIFYQLIGANTDTFAINASTGVISNKVRLDYDSPTFKKGVPFELTIRAREALSFLPDGTPTFEDGPKTTAEVTIKVAVQDINDNSPTFNQATYEAFVNENIVSGANVPGLQMTVTDIDSGTFNSFNLLVKTHSDIFGIIPSSDAASSSATLYVIDGQKIDYETGPREYIVLVEAIENKARPPRSGNATVRVKVRDVNDITPSFDSPSYTRTVSETAPAGTVIITMQATDPEEGAFGTAGIRYKLYGNIPPHFKIDEITGVVTVATCSGTPGQPPCIDYERKREYTLTVSATDDNGSSKGRTRSVPLLIKVLDENDNAPQLEKEYIRYIYEGQTVTVNPLRIDGNDPDTVGGPLTFSLNGDSTTLWQVTPVRDSLTGKYYGNITAKEPIFYEMAPDQAIGEFKFNVIVTETKHSATANVIIRVIDINNHAPVFSMPKYSEIIDETTKGDTFVTKVSATDNDAPTTGNGIIDFNIESGSMGKFRVDNVVQQNKTFIADIYTTRDATFNYETQNEYVMILIARDRGTPKSFVGKAELTVRIRDINNKDPRIYPSFQSINVMENEAVGTTVYMISAQDPDVDSDLKFYMTPTKATDGTGNNLDRNKFDFTQLFRIDFDTGAVIINAPLDRDKCSRITNDLRVVDISAPVLQEGRGTLLIHILEYNDQAPRFDKPEYIIDLEEEQNVNSFVLNLNCVDEDDKIASYTLSHIDPRRPLYFALLPGSGGMIVNERIDYEKIEKIELSAMCVDMGQPPLSNSTRVIVNIININDNVPVFEHPLYRATVPENFVGGKLNVTVKATDADKGDYGNVRYKLDDRYGFFYIDSISGEIFVFPNATFDREQISSLGFLVIAYDSPLDARVRRQTSVPVYVVIEDINDNCPEFSKSLYEGIVPENAELNTDIIDIIVTDKDEGVNSEVVFSIKKGSGNPSEADSLFGVNSYTGRVVVQANLKKKTGVYDFTLLATDMGGRSPGLQCTSEVLVRVHIQVSLNTAPLWRNPPTANTTVDVLESQYEGMLVYAAKAIDNDRGPNGVVDYYFTINGDELVESTPEFRINRVTGVIRAEIEYDRETRDIYFLTLMAKDRGNPASSSEITLIVRILDVNDNEPVFPTKDGVVPPLVLSMRDELSSGKVGSCKASDADSDDKNNQIFYRILDAMDSVAKLVRVDSKTCEIFVTSAVDSTQHPQLVFTILAYNEANDDSVKRYKREVNPSILPVVITINSTVSKPEFLQKQYFACVSVDASYRQSILEVSATDSGTGNSGAIKYAIVGGSSTFEIHRELGIIYNTVTFRRDGRRVYTFKVEASTSKSDTADVTIFITSPSNIVKLKVDRPRTDVEPFKQQLVQTIVSSSPDIKYACVDGIRNHVDDEGVQSLLATDVMVAAVKKDGDNYVIYPAGELADKINDQRKQENSPYDASFVSSAEEEGDDDGFSLKEDAVLAILIICLLLIFLAIVLLIVACCCIRSSKRRKVRKAQSRRHVLVAETPEPVHSSFTNPVYHKGPEHVEYAVVKKQSSKGPIDPVVIAAPQNLQPIRSEQPKYLRPAEPDDSVPVIETEVLPAHFSSSQPSKMTTFQPEYEGRIEAIVVDDEADLPGSRSGQSSKESSRSSSAKAKK